MDLRTGEKVLSSCFFTKEVPTLPLDIIEGVTEKKNQETFTKCIPHSPSRCSTRRLSFQLLDLSFIKLW